MSKAKNRQASGQQFFRRIDLANQLASRVLQPGSASSVASGIFLSAPRRTGKSTFLREDLRPALQLAGAFVLYVDLWSDKKADPGDLIVSAVRSALSGFDGVVSRLARKTGIRDISTGPVTFSLEQIGIGTELTMTDALGELSNELKKPIVLIIDEAQHAIFSENGYDALFALKAARDELNSSSHFGLRVVATGSNPEKLAMLRNSKDQAFFGAPMVSFPRLGKDYIEWFCDRVNLGVDLDVDVIWELFERSGYRPEILGAAADQLRFTFGLGAEDVIEQFGEAVITHIDDADSQTIRVIESLTPLQSAVLRVLAARQQSYAPFTSDSITTYATVLRAIAPGENLVPDTSNVQQALSALQEKMLVWKEQRGVYALEESSLAEVMRTRGMLSAVPSSL
jgi:hypothetical protein